MPIALWRGFALIVAKPSYSMGMKFIAIRCASDVTVKGRRSDFAAQVRLRDPQRLRG